MLHSTWRRIRGATCTIAALVVGLTGVGSPAAAQEVLAALTNDSSTISEPVSFDLSHLLGASGKLRAVQFTQEQLEADSSLGSLVARLNAGTPGLHRTELRSVDGAPLVFVNLIPFEAKTGGTLQGYKVGYWPSERKKGITTALPVGFIEVTDAVAVAESPRLFSAVMVNTESPFTRTVAVPVSSMPRRTTTRPVSELAMLTARISEPVQLKVI